MLKSMESVGWGPLDRRWLKIGFVVAVMLIAATGTAQAEAHDIAEFEVQRAATVGLLYLGARDGYKIGLEMPNDRVALFYVSGFEQANGSIAGSGSVYVVHNHDSLAQGVIRARLGSLGRVSLRFEPNGRIRKQTLELGCKGRQPITEYGRFIGHVSFDGEGGYLHASFAKGRGEVTHAFRLKCKKGRAYDLSQKSLREYAVPSFGFNFFPGEGSVALLYAVTSAHGRSIVIRAAHREGSSPGAEVQLGTLESRGEMVIGRSAYVNGFPGTLRTSLPGVHPATATLAPPAPFYGEADYLEKSPTSHSWTGTLGVNLPGLTLPLTGPGFYTSLCVVSPLKVPDGCDIIKPKPLEPGRRPAPSRWLFQ
jgi:hypothetical protein